MNIIVKILQNGSWTISSLIVPDSFTETKLSKFIEQQFKPAGSKLPLDYILYTELLKSPEHIRKEELLEGPNPKMDCRR